MDYIKNVTVERMKKVIQGNNKGSFVYVELLNLNQKFMDDIANSYTESTINDMWKIIKDKAYLSYKVDTNLFEANATDFEKLSTDDKKRFLVELLDKNMLYVNYCDMEDEDFAVTDADKKLNYNFYKGS